MISLLRDTPLLAIRPIMSALPRAEMLDDHKKLIEYLRINYGDPDEKGTARRKLKGVRQNGSASAYFAELQQYIAILGWKEQEQIVDRAIDGLKPHLKDEIARSGLLPQTLAELIDFVIPLDNRLYERDIERKHEGREQAKTTTRVLSSTTVTTPISTSRPFASYRDQTTKDTTGLGKTTENVVHTSRLTAPATYPRPAILSDAERQRRRDNRLCYRCGAPDHISAECSMVKAARFNAVPVKQETYIRRSENATGPTK